MTFKQLQSSAGAKELLHQMLSNRLFVEILDATQSRAMPSRGKMPIPTPGVHLDTTIAHDHHYSAGWSDCIEFLKGLPTGAHVPLADEQDEEPFAHADDVRAIDAELQLRHPTP